MDINTATATIIDTMNDLAAAAGPFGQPVTAEDLRDHDVEELRAAAGSHGDLEMVEVCDCYLNR